MPNFMVIGVIISIIILLIAIPTYPYWSYHQYYLRMRDRTNGGNGEIKRRYDDEK